MQLTQLPHSELNTVSEGQEEVRTWSCKSIKQAMAGEMEDMKNKLPIQSQSAHLPKASSHGVHSYGMHSSRVRLYWEPVPSTVLHQH